MLTRLEVDDRITRIWPGKKVRDIFVPPPGGFSDTWMVSLEGDVRLHTIDGHGHTTCHKDCIAAESALPF